MTILVVLVFSGLVMLYFVYRQIRSREEWRQNRVAFLSMWGLSCLFGTTWVLAFLSFGPLSELFVFLFCILNSLQGLHMLNATSPNSSVLLSAATVIRRVHEWLDGVIFYCWPWYRVVIFGGFAALYQRGNEAMAGWSGPCFGGAYLKAASCHVCWFRPKNRALPFSSHL